MGWLTWKGSLTRWLLLSEQQQRHRDEKGPSGRHLWRILHAEHIGQRVDVERSSGCLWHLEEMHALGQRYRGPDGESGVCPKGGVDA